MINAFDNNLRITTGSTPGYKRDQDGDTYDSREWGFIDLRIAGALARMGNNSQSKTLLDWMTSQATANYDLIPELLDWTTQDYAGSVPMAGLCWFRTDGRIWFRVVHPWH
jgi:GH15 family glucan-1,4-alpha-glucosidase